MVFKFKFAELTQGAVKKAPCKKRRINDFLIVKDPSFVLKLTCNEKFNTKVL